MSGCPFFRMGQAISNGLGLRAMAKRCPHMSSLNPAQANQMLQWSMFHASSTPSQAASEAVKEAEAKKAAKGWTAYLDESLREMKIDHVDAYYYMGQNNVSIIKSEEIYKAFEDAKAQGKVSYLGISTHQNAANVLDAAADTGWFDLAMIAITPGGWYDWEDKSILPGSPSLKELQPVLEKAKKAGIGLVGMKAGRFIAGRAWLGWGNPDAFDKYYDEKLLKAKLSAFQRSYAFILENGLDVVNADMQNLLHLKENFVAAATLSDYFYVA